MLKIFLNEISKVKYKGRIDDSMYHGKVHCDGRNTGDNGFFLRFQQFAKTINHINKYIVIMPGVQMAMWQDKNTAKLILYSSFGLMSGRKKLQIPIFKDIFWGLVTPFQN